MFAGAVPRATVEAVFLGCGADAEAAADALLGMSLGGGGGGEAASSSKASPVARDDDDNTRGAHEESEAAPDLWDTLPAEAGRSCKLDPGLKAHPVSKFDCEKDVTVPFNLNLIF